MPSASSRRPPPLRLLAILLALVVVAFGVMVQTHIVAEAAGADSSGYLNEARLLAAGHLKVRQPMVPAADAAKLTDDPSVPLGFRSTLDGDMIPTYPVGLPLMIAAAAKVGGWGRAGAVVVWFHALSGLVLTYALARRLGLTFPAASVAVILLATSPLYLLSSEQALSDGPAMVWCTAAVVAALSARRKPGWALVAGAAFSVAVAIRPTNALIALPLALALGRPGRAWPLFVVGCLPGFIALGLFQQHLYGSALSTGYGNVSTLFGWRFLLPTLADYSWAIPLSLTPAVVLVAGLPWVAARRQEALLLGLWILLFAGFYAFYYCTHEVWWYLRFLLPAFPALCVAVAMVGQQLVRRYPPDRKSWAAVAASLGAVAWGIGAAAKYDVLDLPQHDRTYVDAVRWIHRHLPGNAVIATMQASGTVYALTDNPLLRYDIYAAAAPADSLASVAAGASKAGRPVYALMAPFEVHPALERQMPGHWTLTAIEGDWTIWHLDDLVPTPIGSIPRVLTRLETAQGEILALIDDSWYGIETGSSQLRVWSRGDSTIAVSTQPRFSRKLTLRLTLDSRVATDVRIMQDGKLLWSGTAAHGTTPVDVPFELRDGKATLRLMTTAPGFTEDAGRGGRRLTFAILDPQLRLD